MKQSLQEIGMGDIAPEQRGPNPHGNRMKWKPGQKPGQGNPLLHPDEQAALGELPSADEFIDDPSASMTVDPDLAGVEPVQGEPKPLQSNPRFNWKEGDPGIPSKNQPKPRFRWRAGLRSPEKPDMGMDFGAAIDELKQQLSAEENAAPHLRNNGKIARLKSEIMSMMAKEESLRIMRQADRLLPCIQD